LKSSGGLTRGRGVDDFQTSVWTAIAPLVAQINLNMRELTKISIDTTKHKELYPGRKEKDTIDTMALARFYSVHNPFRPPCLLRNIASGVHAHSAVNIMNCKNIGLSIVDTMVGKSANDITFSKSACAVPINGVGHNGNSSHNKLAPQKLFQRLVSTSAKLKMDTGSIVGKYELTQFPPSLFKSGHIMHRPNKPDFKSIYDDFIGNQPQPNLQNSIYIFDGGHLIHTIPWSRGQTISQLVSMYVDFLTHNFDSPENLKNMVIFDGYPDYSTKDSEHLDRSKGVIGPEVKFDADTVITLGKDIFKK
jgi:hypothetical protein